MAMRIERPHCTKTLTPRHRSTRSVGDRLRAARAHAAGPRGASTSAAAAAAIIVPLLLVVVVVVVVVAEEVAVLGFLGSFLASGHCQPSASSSEAAAKVRSAALLCRISPLVAISSLGEVGCCLGVEPHCAQHRGECDRRACSDHCG